MADAHSRRVASDVAVEDLTTQDRIAETSRLFAALRIPERAPGAYVLGVSAFTHDRPPPDSDPHLQAFAKNIGADYVAVSQQVARRNRTVYQPVTMFSGSSATGYATVGGSTATNPGHICTLHAAVGAMRRSNHDPHSCCSAAKALAGGGVFADRRSMASARLPRKHDLPDPLATEEAA